MPVPSHKVLHCLALTAVVAAAAGDDVEHLHAYAIRDR